jgi:hypothetical protein
MSDRDQATSRSGTSECLACPICTGLAALRQAQPEVVEHLVKAGAELLLAVRAVLDGVGHDGHDGRDRRDRRDRHRAATVQRIDIA